MKLKTLIRFDDRGTHTNWVIPAGLCPVIFCDAIKFHGLHTILDWLAAWHKWPQSLVKFFDQWELVS